VDRHADIPFGEPVSDTDRIRHRAGERLRRVPGQHPDRQDRGGREEEDGVAGAALERLCGAERGVDVRRVAPRPVLEQRLYGDVLLPHRRHREAYLLA
jgi:hypothetical protein